MGLYAVVLIPHNPVSGKEPAGVFCVRRTIHAATEFSLLCVTSDYPGIYESVIRPFIVEYPYLVSLALAQRTGIAVKIFGSSHHSR